MTPPTPQTRPQSQALHRTRTGDPFLTMATAGSACVPPGPTAPRHEAPSGTASDPTGHPGRPQDAPSDAFPRLVGRCPACGGNTLFAGSGGYVTCSLLECPDPCAASDLLERQRPWSSEAPEVLDPAEYASLQGALGRVAAALAGVPSGRLDRLVHTARHLKLPASHVTIFAAFRDLRQAVEGVQLPAGPVAGADRRVG